VVRGPCLHGTWSFYFQSHRDLDSFNCGSAAVYRVFKSSSLSALPPAAHTEESSPVVCHVVYAAHRYLLQQGYTGEGDLVIITPYVGQLQRLRKAVANSKMKVILIDRDSEQLAELDEAAAAAADGQPPSTDGMGSRQAAGTASSSSSSSSRAHQSSASSGVLSRAASGAVGGGSRQASVVEMGQCLRLATIDNFQVSNSAAVPYQEEPLAIRAGTM